jgi:hypothetical protein
VTTPDEREISSPIMMLAAPERSRGKTLIHDDDAIDLYLMFNVCHVLATARPYLGRLGHA